MMQVTLILIKDLLSFNSVKLIIQTIFSQYAGANLVIFVLHMTCNVSFNLHDDQK